jgi:hypothetical protein
MIAKNLYEKINAKYLFFVYHIIPSKYPHFLYTFENSLEVIITSKIQNKDYLLTNVK